MATALFCSRLPGSCYVPGSLVVRGDQNEGIACEFSGFRALKGSRNAAQKVAGPPLLRRIHSGAVRSALETRQETSNSVSSEASRSPEETSGKEIPILGEVEAAHVAETREAGEFANGSATDSGETSTDGELAAGIVASSKGTVQESQKLTLDDVNPVGLGRRSRQLFDDVWRRLVQLGQLTQPPLEEEYEVLAQGPNCDFTTPNAKFTTVFVAGATGRVGRVLVRKLLLRGYSVKALVRNRDPETLEKLPRSVEVVVGDLGDPASLRSAVEGCTKVIFCARARSDISGDLIRVEQQGVDNLARAVLDYNNKLALRRRGRSIKSKLTIAKFNRPQHQEGWELREGGGEGSEFDPRYDGGCDAELEFTEKGTAVFKGFVFTKGGYVEAARPLQLPEGTQLARYEGFLLNVVGDGKAYTLVMATQPDEFGNPGRLYSARFNTRKGHCRVRIPFSVMRPAGPDDPPLDVGLVREFGIRFEPRRMRGGPVRSVKNGKPTEGQDDDESSFRLELDFIKALPGGEETDFILVSCTGAGVSQEVREKVVRAKMGGEQVLRNSGLGYTIVRPGPLQEEPGGQRALVFDQGNRISQGISCADVADVCVKALHDPAARNKSFDVCYEYTDGQGLYELVAHLPDKANSYLTPALQLLEKNT